MQSHHHQTGGSLCMVKLQDNLWWQPCVCFLCFITFVLGTRDTYDFLISEFILYIEMSLCILQFLFGCIFVCIFQDLYWLTWRLNLISKPMKIIGSILMESTWAEKGLVVPWTTKLTRREEMSSQPVEHGLQGHGE